MKNLIKISVLSLLAVLIGSIAFWLVLYQNSGFFGVVSQRENAPETLENEILETEEDISSGALDMEVIASDLSIPWDIAFLPTGEMIVTERGGDLLFFKNGRPQRINIPGVEHAGEGGLLGVTLHPDFSSNNYLYLYHTREAGDGLINQIVRYEFIQGSLNNPEVILGNIPGASFHDGGRLAFGPDGALYVTVGDAGDEEGAQDIEVLSGKILRLNDDGSIPEDNPFVNLPAEEAGAVWSYGHRNPQGLAWDNEGRLWSTEHGRSGILSGLDELNIIEKGKNYGWPKIEGDEVLPETVAPIIHSGADDTWAPASALYYDGSVFFGGLRGEALYEAKISGDQVTELKEHFKGEFGRIRTVTLGPDEMFYLTTSNRDGRGNVRAGDDKIIRVNLQVFR